MISSPCIGSYTPTPCDGAQACKGEHFATQDDYLACLNANATTVSGCISDCTSTKIDTDNDAETAGSSCNDGCTATYGTGISACEAADASCKSSCDSDHDSCIASCTDTDFDACVAACDSARDSCYTDCDAAEIDCEKPVLLAKIVCGQGCSDTLAAALDDSTQTYDNCAKSCCSTNTNNPDNCGWECQAQFDGDSADNTQTVADCNKTCNELQVTAFFSSEDADALAYLDCTNACSHAADEDNYAATISKAQCDRACKVKDMQVQQWCDWVENACMSDCEKAFENTGETCHDAQLEALATCFDTLQDCNFTCDSENNDCTDACDPFDTGCVDACNAAHSSCLDTCTSNDDDCTSAANDDFNSCIPSYYATRYDCNFACCAASEGGDASMNCYKACWHSAGCSDTSVDCSSALNACLWSCPGAYGSGDAPVFATCNDCGTAAALGFPAS